MTDLKTATQMLADAIAALESEQHDADCAEAEAIRNRLLILDAEIGKRIQAKLDAHRLIIDQWGVSEAVVPRKLEEIETPLADAWNAHHKQTWNVNGVEMPFNEVGRYELSGDQLVNSVAEMPQVAQAE